MTPDLIVGGHVLTVAVGAPSWMGTVPSTVLTISDCFRRPLPRPPFWDWWVDLEGAELVRSRLARDALLATVALSPADAAVFMDDVGGPDQPFFATLRRAVPFEGEVLGWEVVGAEESLGFHSWHCHSYADDVSDALGIGLDDLGLLRTRADADAVLRWMLALPADDAPEPVPWVVVALGVVAPSGTVEPDRPDRS